MLCTTLASSRVLRVCVFGLTTAATAVIFTSDAAQARRSQHHRQARHQEARQSHSPAFSSIIVDGNSGATLSANNPDASRHPASLTKIMTLYLLFERLDSGQVAAGSEMGRSGRASERGSTQLGLPTRPTLRVGNAPQGPGTAAAEEAAP